MARPVVHSEIMGRDGAQLRALHSDLLDRKRNTDNPFGSVTIEREDNLSAEGVGVGGGIATVTDPEGNAIGVLKQQSRSRAGPAH